MIILTLVGFFQAMTGIILHSISKTMIEFKAEIIQIRRANYVYSHKSHTRNEELLNGFSPVSNLDYRGLLRDMISGRMLDELAI